MSADVRLCPVPGKSGHALTFILWRMSLSANRPPLRRDMRRRRRDPRSSRRVAPVCETASIDPGWMERPLPRRLARGLRLRRRLAVALVGIAPGRVGRDDQPLHPAFEVRDAGGEIDHQALALHDVLA